jgi:hypothetical protein
VTRTDSERKSIEEVEAALRRHHLTAELARWLAILEHRVTVLEKRQERAAMNQEEDDG